MTDILLSNYKPSHKYMICIDSDGCAFDTMELKHKECFCPATIQVWGLQPISKYVRAAWEYSNLYSKDRGRSRFHEMLLVFDLLEEWEEVKQYHFRLPDITPLRKWVESGTILNNEQLAKQVDDPIMKQALDWSLEVNRRVADMVSGVPPFPGVRESLEVLYKNADIVIVSATERKALEREWTEHGMLKFVRCLCGQEDGSKAECIHALRGHYELENILMIGDAPGDLEAARSNDVLYFPIRPGEEVDSWRAFGEEGIDRFLAGTFVGEYEKALITQFDACLPNTPPWKCK